MTRFQLPILLGLMALACAVAAQASTPIRTNVEFKNPLISRWILKSLPRGKVPRALVCEPRCSLKSGLWNIKKGDPSGLVYFRTVETAGVAQELFDALQSDRLQLVQTYEEEGWTTKIVQQNEGRVTHSLMCSEPTAFNRESTGARTVCIAINGEIN